MIQTLDVYLNRNLVGHVSQDEHGQMSFCYATKWLKKPQTFALSHSLPLQAGIFTRRECQGWAPHAKTPSD